MSTKKTCIEIDESDAPYKEGERPYPRTLQDDLLLLKIIEENNWELEPNSKLAKLQNIKHLLPPYSGLSKKRNNEK